MKIGFIGGGNMATALIGGLVASGRAAAELHVVEPLAEARQRLAASAGVVCHASAEDAALQVEVLVLAVKPQQMRAAVAPLAGRLGAQLVVSIAAGLRLADLRRWLGGYARLVRAMPNTPALVGAGITGLYAAPGVSAAEKAAAQAVLETVGETVWVDDEALMDAVTAVSGSGPAYVFHFIEALEAAGVAQGFDAATARRLALGTVLGAARLAAGSDESPARLRERVTSPGGTTEAALRSFERDGLKAAVARAVEAAEKRGRELGEVLGGDA